MTASIWKQGLIGATILEKNLCCICLSPPLITLPVVQEVTMEMPQIKSTLHSIVVRDDVIPRLTMFLDPENEDICSEHVFNSEQLMPLSSIKVSLKWRDTNHHFAMLLFIGFSRLIYI